MLLDDYFYYFRPAIRNSLMASPAVGIICTRPELAANQQLCLLPTVPAARPPVCKQLQINKFQGLHAIGPPLTTAGRFALLARQST